MKRRDACAWDLRGRPGATLAGLSALSNLTPFPETVSVWSMAKTNQERLQALRAKRDAAGWKRFEVWCHPLDWPMVKRYVADLRKRRERK